MMTGGCSWAGGGGAGTTIGAVGGVLATVGGTVTIVVVVVVAGPSRDSATASTTISTTRIAAAMKMKGPLHQLSPDRTTVIGSSTTPGSSTTVVRLSGSRSTTGATMVGSGSVARVGVPHLPQNCDPTSISAPHLRQ